MKIPKCFNMSYNTSYNKKEWLEDMLKIRKMLPIVFHSHVFKRKHRNLDLDNIEATIREGKIKARKCRRPNKVCFTRYFGKENRTYFVIVMRRKKRLEVITSWIKNGKI